MIVNKIKCYHKKYKFLGKHALFYFSLLYWRGGGLLFWKKVVVTKGIFLPPTFTPQQGEKLKSCKMHNFHEISSCCILRSLKRALNLLLWGPIEWPHNRYNFLLSLDFIVRWWYRPLSTYSILSHMKSVYFCILFWEFFEVSFTFKK